MKKAHFIGHVPTIGAMHIGSVEQLAVNFVGRRKYDGSIRIAPSYGFEDIQRSAAVDLEIRSWIIKARGDGDLRGEMHHAARGRNQFVDRINIARIGDLD